MHRFLVVHIIYLLLLTFSGSLKGQVSSYFTKEVVVPKDCTVFLDSLTIIPSSIMLDDISIDEFIESYLPQGFIINKDYCKVRQGDTLYIKYATFGLDLTAPYQSKKLNILEKKEKAIQLLTLKEDIDNTNRVFTSDKLSTNGSFARGLSIGNRQDLLLNSRFNLSLSGDIGEGINVLAAISDDNIPIQPEGNTQVIQDFDRVFIKVSKDSTSLIAGDYNLNRPPSYFMNVFKKLKGLSVGHTQSLDSDMSLSGKGSFAISRGKFARQTLNITEGNFGPYRLTGNNNERFLIVLSGTERVYRDGQLLTRGFNHDYVIDYNRAEITFMPTRIMNREDRIVVEYEYRDQNYLRTLYATTTTFSSQRLNANINFYSEQDSKNALGDLVLDSIDRRRLSEIGDNLDQAFISGIRTINDTTASILNTYELVPNPDPDIPQKILQFSVDKTKTLYQAIFTEVGRGEGDYEIDTENVVNGRVYTYVGAGKGKYAPVINLVPPERKSMLTVNSTYRPSSKSSIRSELALSNRDYNLYSDADNDDNVGLAGMLEYNQDYWLDTTGIHLINTNFSVEQLGSHFNPLNPYRNLEFSRDWNFTNTDQLGERLINAKATYIHPTFGNMQYGLSQYTVKDKYKGVKHNLNTTAKLFNTAIKGRIDLLNSRDTAFKTSFLRPYLQLKRALLWDIQTQLVYDAEFNHIYEKDKTDTLADKSLGYEMFILSINKKTSGGFSVGIKAKGRKDLYPETDQLITGIKSRSIEGEMSYTNSAQRFSLNIGSRRLNVIDRNLVPESTKDGNNLIGRLLYNLNALNDGLRWQSSFQTNAGQEPKIEYVYEKVERGQGSYIYIGNPDSVLINGNFRYAPELGTAEYIRISLFNNEFITTQNQELVQSLNIDFKRFMDREDAQEPFLARFSTANNIRITRKTRSGGTNPFSSLNIFKIDTSVVTYNSALNNILFYNKGERRGDLKIGHQLLSSVFTQINGREDRSQRKYFLEGRLNFQRKLDLLFSSSWSKKKYESEVFEDRRFIIDKLTINPRLSLRPINTLRLETGYEYDSRKQRIFDKEKATSHAWNTAISYRRSSTSLLNLEFSYVGVDYTGVANSILEFEILEGLKNGHNFIWNINMTQRLQQNLELNISYQGRKNGENIPVHIGRAQFRATF